MQDRLIGLILVMVFAIISVIFQIRTPKILGEATTEIFKGLMKGNAQQKAGFNIGSLPINYEKIFQIILIVIVMYLAAAIFSFLQQYIMTRISQNTVYKLRRQMKQKKCVWCQLSITIPTATVML